MEAVAPAISEASPHPARVLIVCPEARGGLARHVVTLLADLCRSSYVVGVACEPDGPVARAARDRDLPVCGMAVSSRGGPPRAALAAVHVARAGSELQAQIVHTHSFTAGLIGALAMPLVPTGRMVATIHNYPPDADGMQAHRRQHRWAIGLTCRRAIRVVTVSEALRRDLVAVRPEVADKVVTIPNGVDTRAAPARRPDDTRSDLGLPAEAPVVGMLARLAPQKGIVEFIRAARAVADTSPDVHFVLAGEGPLKEDALALRREIALEDRLHILGEIEWPRELIAALDVLVVASVSEGSSVVAMEAMALGKPVVATAVGGVPEVVSDGETGILVEPGDSGALARGIEELLASPERARDLGERGRRRAAAHFDVQHMLERTKMVYADLLRQEIEAGGNRT